MKSLKSNHPLHPLTSMGLGGPARYFVIVKREKEMAEAIAHASKHDLVWNVIGEGSNLIVSDKGFAGLIIKNEIWDIKISKHGVIVGAGANLLNFIRKMNKLGLGGLEKMAGIPGTIGGAIYGCAGAYGQEIRDTIVRVRIFDGKIFRWLSGKQCRFNYRSSVFKTQKNWIIVAAEFKFKKSNLSALQKVSKNIVALRKKKYPPGLLCPGSFFKNVVTAELPLRLQKRILPMVGQENLQAWHGKIPAAWFLDQIGAKGMKVRGIAVAQHHANLVYNTGAGTVRDLEKIVKILKIRVRRKFGVSLEEEVQYL